MTATISYRPSRLARLGRLVANLGIGAVLTTQALTSVLALGWLTRRMGWITRTRMGAAEDAPGWLLGPREKGRIVRALGGLAANIRAGAVTLAALLSWTLPFSIFWLGAWWAGWENSFNKGYEQALVGPSVFLTGMGLAALILPVLPLMLAHVATEDRLSAAYEMRRIRGVVAQSGWRLAWLSAVTLVFATPLFAVHGVIIMGHEFFPGLEDMTPEAAAELKGRIVFGAAAVTFAALMLLRGMAARIYAFAAPRAAALRPGLWDGSVASDAARPAQGRSRLAVALWVAIAVACSGAFAFLILSTQFLDHAWWRWITHPYFGLPWPG
ncbi:MAG: hypothetical protein V4516_01845 [Pseudomonadota bacterium]